MNKLIKNILTERDNSTICAYRVIAFAAGLEMLGKFIFVSGPQFQDFASGIAAIGVAIAAKNWSEK